jgi:hypothetical protein
LNWISDKKSIFSLGAEVYDENDLDAPCFEDEEVDG